MLEEAAVRCRAAILEAIIKFRLNGAWYADTDTASFQQNVVSHLSARWRQQWPAGILVPTANIPNRDPFTQTQLVGPLDPFYRRTPRARWTRPAAKILDGIVVRLSEFLSHNDVKRVDEALNRLAESGAAPTVEMTNTCDLRFVLSDTTPLMVECPEFSSSFGLRAWLKLSPDGTNNGRVTSVRINGVEETLWVDLENISIEEQADDRLLLRFVQAQNLNPRRRNGDLIESLALTWDRGDTSPLRRADATLTIRTDFFFVSEAIERMVGKTLRGEIDVFSARPFRRRATLEALYHELKMAPLTWCC